jgi:hypothetical protein
MTPQGIFEASGVGACAGVDVGACKLGEFAKADSAGLLTVGVLGLTLKVVAGRTMGAPMAYIAFLRFLFMELLYSRDQTRSGLRSK